MACMMLHAGSLLRLHLEAFWGAVIRWIYDSCAVDEAMQGLIAAFELFCACLHRPLLQQNMALTDAQQPARASAANSRSSSLEHGLQQL